jgi:hypothetical protein
MLLKRRAGRPEMDVRSRQPTIAALALMAESSTDF